MRSGGREEEESVRRIGGVEFVFVPHNFEFSEKNERNLIERIYFCLREPEKLERRDGKVLPCCVHAMLQKKEDLSAKASALVVLYVLFVSDHAEVRSITNISSLSVFAGASAISDQRQPHDLFHWFSLFCTRHPFRRQQSLSYIALYYLSLSLFTSCSALVVLLLCWCSENARTSPIASSALGISVSFHSRLLTS